MRVFIRIVALTVCGLFAGAAFADAPTYHEFIEGKADAKITVVEYASLTCHFCADFSKNNYSKLKAEYIDTGKVKFIYRDFPTDGLAAGAALITRCVPSERGKTLVDLMFKNQAEWMRAEKPIEVLRGYGQLAGMTLDDVDACLKNEAIFADIQDVRQKAVSLYKVQATPTFFIGNDKVEGNNYPALKAAIDKQLK